MKIWLKRSRLIKLTLVALCLVVAVPFFLSKPRGQDVRRREESLEIPKVGAVFREHVLGNFEQVPLESEQKGPGEQGKPHHPSAEKQNEVSQKMMEFGINTVVSDEVSLDRVVPDLRLPECKQWHYPPDMPKTSVIVVFHNEGWSPLLRTVHSVINRSPPQFLQEVLLVDDFSDKEHLKEPLEKYIRKFDGKVRLIRNAQREGLIRTRTLGAKEAHGEVILFLDAHCEVGHNWLPPLISPIYMNHTVMTVPVIDGIDRDTLEYRPVYTGKTHFRGIFEWGMFYKEIELPEIEERKRKHQSEPYPSPTHAGGLFAMNRRYFLKLGGYDPGLLVWGGENFELSFKIWQCGGSILWVPCSRVGHIYRAFMPYTFGKLADKKKGPIITLNYKRVIEVWMDEYKEFFYTREPLARFLDAGDISKQLALREKLQCRSFDWFMNNVAFDVFSKYPRLPKNDYWGEVRMDYRGGLCWDGNGDLGDPDEFHPIILSSCHGDAGDQVRNLATGSCLDSLGPQPPHPIGTSYCHQQGVNQLFRLNAEGQLGVGERCIDADTDGVKLVFCRLGTVDGPWLYDKDDKTLYHKNLKKCVVVDTQDNALKLLPCDASQKSMKVDGYVCEQILVIPSGDDTLENKHSRIDGVFNSFKLDELIIDVSIDISKKNMADDQTTTTTIVVQPESTSEVNQDDLILAQEKQIEKEIAESTPLVGSKADLMGLQNEYAADDAVYQQKVKDLRSKYQNIRRTRGDGNCFYRAFTFAYLESLLDDKPEYNRFKILAAQSKDNLVQLGYSQFTIEDFYDTFMEVVHRVGDGAKLEYLIDILNDQSYSDYLVVYMRLITSGHLQKEAEFYANFVEGDRSVKEFCQQEVEPMFKESDHIHVIALTSALGVGVRLQYMDRGEGSKVITHDFPEGSEPRVNLLYRPGHYDILYP